MSKMDIRQRKQMAMGDGPYAGNTLSVPSMGSRAIPHPDRDMDTSKQMGESSRAMSNPVGQGAGNMAKCAEVDHGPHNHRYVRS